jgi:CRP-like cAMP-binding protein
MTAARRRERKGRTMGRVLRDWVAHFSRDRRFVELLEQVPWFKGLSSEALLATAREVEEVSFASGAFLCREGEHEDAVLLVIESGSARMFMSMEAAGWRDPADLGEVEPGFSFGWAFLFGAPATASLQAVEATRALKLTRAGFDRCAQRFPAVWTQLKGYLAEELGARAERDGDSYSLHEATE